MRASTNDDPMMLHPDQVLPPSVAPRNTQERNAPSRWRAPARSARVKSQSSKVQPSVTSSRRSASAKVQLTNLQRVQEPARTDASVRSAPTISASISEVSST
jgi:hypothetical protein